MATDEDLVVRLAAGDQRALAELLGRWDHPLYAFITRQGAGTDAEDLRQETWMRVVRAADRFDRSRRFSTWLFAIALNLCRDWNRRRPPPVLDQAAVSRVLGGSDGGQRAIEAGLDAGQLLAQLPENLRSAVVLRHYHDLSEEEMAEVMDVPRGTVKSRLHHAVRKLMDLVAQRGGR